MKRNTMKFANWLTKWNSWDQIISISLATLIFVVAVVLLYSYRRRKLRRSSDDKKSQDYQGLIEYQPRHNWQFNDLFTTPTYCNVR